MGTANVGGWVTGALIAGWVAAGCVPPESPTGSMEEDVSSTPASAPEQAACGVRLGAADPQNSTTANQEDETRVATECEAGQQSSCVKLGLLQIDHARTSRSALEGAALYRRATGLFDAACAAGHAPGCTRLGKWMETARRDALQSAALYYPALVTAHNHLRALFYPTSKEIEEGKVRSLAAYRKGCDGGDAEGCVALGVRLAEVDDRLAKDPLTRACQQHPRHCMFLGGLYIQRGVSRDRTLALSLLTRACEGGETVACHILGTVFLRDPAKPDACAADLFAGSCERGHAKSCAELGKLFEEGRGVDKDQQRADDLYVRACDGQHAGACSSIFNQLCRAGVAESCNVLGDLAHESLRPGSGADVRRLRDVMERVEPLYTRACEGGHASACTREADRHLRKGSPVSAAAGFEKSCGMGNSMGCLRLAEMLKAGHGVDKDETRAATFYSAACDGGYLNACLELGRMLEVGRGVPRDEARAASVHASACDKGAADSCFSLGEMFEQGRGVSKDDARAAGAYARGCAFGEPLSCGKFSAVSIPPAAEQSARAAALFTRSCDGGHAPACAGLGVMVTLGRGADKDDARAAALFAGACDGGDASACSVLGLMSSLGQGVVKDESRAAALQVKACDGGVLEGCFHGGESFERGLGVAKDEARAAALFTKACDRSYGPACSRLGEMLEEGRGGGKDEARAVAVLTKACDGGMSESCVDLGYLLEQGRGGGKDEARVAGLFAKVCAGGHVRDCVALRELFQRTRRANRAAVTASK